MNENEKESSTKERIRNIAIDLFAGKGYRDVSVRDIAREVGIKASSLYKHYRNKEDILQSIFALFQEKVAQAVITDEQLKQYIQSVSIERYFNDSFAMFMSVMWSPIIVRIAKIITIEQQRNQSIREFYMREMIEKPKQNLQYALELMMENGKILPVDAKVVAEEYAGYIIYLYFEQNFLHDGPDIEEIKRKMNQHNAFYIQYLKERGEQ